MEMTNIHNEYYAVLNNYISKRVSNKEDVKDLLQEVFIKILGNSHSLGQKENLKAWLFTITKNVIIDYYRKNSKNKTFSDINHFVNLNMEERELNLSRDLESCIHRFIGRLPQEYQNIIIDSEIKGIKQKDLTDKYNIAYPSVRSRIQRGRAKLKEMLIECCKMELDRRGNIFDFTPHKNKC